MNQTDTISDDDSSSCSDDSFCEHGYPLHEDSLTVDRIGDNKAVVTITDVEDYDHMFLVPYMRGESPLNDMIKHLLTSNYAPAPKKENGDVRDTDFNDGLFVPIDFGQNRSDSENSEDSSSDFSRQGFSSKKDTKGPLRPVPVMTAKDAAPNFNDKEEKSNGKPMFQGTEYYKMMMGALWSNPIEDRIKEIAEAGISTMGDDTTNGKTEPVGGLQRGDEDQLSDYSKLLTELSSAMDESLMDSNVDYDGKPKPFVCTMCDWGFSAEEDLNNHQRLHSGERPYQCEFCIGNFQDKTALLNHRRQHTGEKPYKCDICGTCFSQKHSLVVHKNVHTGEKKYKCDLCDSCFVCRSNLNVHMRIHTGAKPYTCEFCQTSYAQKSQLTVHKRIHTGEKPYKCQLCPSAFAVRGHLIHHIRTHTGEKPHVCGECGSSFTKRCSLKVHMRAHTGETPYRCAFCDQAFHLKNMLTKHLLNFHRIAKKMHTPPQKEGDPHPTPLEGLAAPKGPGRPTTVARIPGAVFTPLKGSRSRSNTQTSDKSKSNPINTKTSSDNTKKPNKPDAQIISKSDKLGTPKSSDRNNLSTSLRSKPTKLNSLQEPKLPGKTRSSTSNKNPKQTSKESKNEKLELHNGGKRFTPRRKIQKDSSDESEEESLLDYSIKAKLKKSNTKQKSEINISEERDLEPQSEALSLVKPKINSPSSKDKLTPKSDPLGKVKGEIEGIDLRKAKPSNNHSKPHSEGPNAFVNPNTPEFMSQTLGYQSTMPMGYPGFGSQAPWANLNHAAGYQSSPVAQRMATQFGPGGAGMQPAAMKSMMEAYAAGMSPPPFPGMMDAYQHELLTGMMGNSSSQNMLGQRFPGATGPMSPGFSDGPFS